MLGGCLLGFQVCMTAVLDGLDVRIMNEFVLVF